MRVRTLSLNAKGEPEEHIEPSQFPTVEDAIKTVESLRLYAKQAADRERPKVKTDKKRYQGHAARQTFVNDLVGLWAEVFDELPGGSIKSDTQKENGPFVSFVLACHAPLERQFPKQKGKKGKGLDELNENAVRAHFRKSGVAKLKRYVNQTMAESD